MLFYDKSQNIIIMESPLQSFCCHIMVNLPEDYELEVHTDSTDGVGMSSSLELNTIKSKKSKFDKKIGEVNKCQKSNLL